MSAIQQLGHITLEQAVHDLGSVNPDLAGIYSPQYEDKEVQRYIHKQFLDDAAHYASNYQNNDYWLHLMQGLAQQLPWQADSELEVLDIGSGAGNTLFALFQSYPQSHIIASDLSVPLLNILKQHYQQHHSQHHCTALQLNAEAFIFAPEQFDLIVGGAILHHLYHPEKTLAQSYKALKPEGYAAFFEPFEMGYQTLSLILRQLWEMNKQSHFGKIERPIIQLFKRLYKELSLRSNQDKSARIFQKMDDKWLFSRPYFEEIGKDLGFESVHCYSLHSTETIFADQINTWLRLQFGKDLSHLPRWARQHIQMMDKHYSASVRAELFTEGGVLFKKAANKL